MELPYARISSFTEGKQWRKGTKQKARKIEKRNGLKSAQSCAQRTAWGGQEEDACRQ
jgi:hypothetical protein